MSILIINGPNLNMLGSREPEIYGHETLGDIEILARNKAAELGYSVDFRQSNHEGVIIDWIQEAAQNKAVKGVIINAGAYTHTSIAIHDALKVLNIPIIEVHISNPKAREEFRHHSFIEPLAAAAILGQGASGYSMAIEKLAEFLTD